ncbi:MAG: (4Fe-4S)-binding protein [Lutibacter sp.]
MNEWIKINGATSKEIIDAVAKCPSGALSIK